MAEEKEKKTNGQAMQNFLNSNIGQGIMSGINGLGSMSSAIASGDSANIVTAGVDTAADIASNFGPYGQVVGTGLKVVNTLVNTFAKPVTVKENVAVTDSGAFGGVKAKKFSGGWGSMFNRGKQRRSRDTYYGQARNAQETLDTSAIALDAANQSSGMIDARTRMNFYGNANRNSDQVTIGEKGMSLSTIVKHKEVVLPDNLKKIIKIDNTKVIKHQSGGVLGKNVIVSGSFHSRKHSLKDLEAFKDTKMTDKGVPVIALKDGGSIEQLAEVEKNEIILTKDLTTKLESLAKENTKESQLEAGKLLAYEIVKNTIDSSDKVLKNS